MSRATNDLNAVRMVLGPGIMYSATTIITMIMAILVMVTLSPSLTLWVLLPAPVVAVAVWFFGKTIHDLYEKIQAALATLTARVQENLAGVRVVRAYAQDEAEIRGFDEPNANVLEGAKPRGEIEFRLLTFTYPTTLSGNGSNGPSKSNGSGPHPVLRDIHLKVPAGSTLAIVGPTGSGKTTLAALIARLWEAPGDSVLIDGRPIREWPLTTLRQALGFVPQDTYLFGDTLGGTTPFGLP